MGIRTGARWICLYFLMMVPRPVMATRGLHEARAWPRSTPARHPSRGAAGCGTPYLDHGGHWRGFKRKAEHDRRPRGLDARTEHW